MVPGEEPDHWSQESQHPGAFEATGRGKEVEVL
jgi:hypothetical protein